MRITIPVNDALDHSAWLVQLRCDDVLGNDTSQSYKLTYPPPHQHHSLLKVNISLLVKAAATLQETGKKTVNMHRFLLYGLALLCGHASATVIRQQIVSEFESCDITPAWERTNDLNIVPLVPEARTGLVPPEVEEGLIYARQFLSAQK
jgi:hypothetical protein